MENESKQLLFFKNRIKSKIESLKPYISNQKYKLYCVMLDECQSLEEIKAMAEIDFQFELAKYIRNLELRLNGMDTTLEELKMADKTLINSSKGVIIKPAKRSKPLVTEEELDDMLNNDLVMTAAANSLAMRLAMTPKEELQQTNELTEEEEALEELNNLDLDSEDDEEDLGDYDLDSDEEDELDEILNEEDEDEEDLGDYDLDSLDSDEEDIKASEVEKEPLKEDEIDFGDETGTSNIWESASQKLADEEGVDLDHIDDLFNDSEDEEDLGDTDEDDIDEEDDIFEDDDDDEDEEEDAFDPDDLDSLFDDDNEDEAEEDNFDPDDYDEEDDEDIEEEIDSIFDEEEDDEEESDDEEDNYDLDSLFDDDDEEVEEDNFESDDDIFDEDSDDSDIEEDNYDPDDFDTDDDEDESDSEEDFDPNDLDSLFSDDDSDSDEDNFDPDDDDEESEDDETDIDKLLSALDDEDDDTDSEDDEPAEPEDSSTDEDDEDSIDKLLAELDMNLGSSNKMSANKNNDIQEYLDKQNNKKPPRSREVDKIFVNGTERGQKTQTMYNGIAKLLNLSGKQGRKIKGKAKRIVNSSFFQL